MQDLVDRADFGDVLLGVEGIRVELGSFCNLRRDLASSHSRRAVVAETGNFLPSWLDSGRARGGRRARRGGGEALSGSNTERSTPRSR